MEQAALVPINHLDDPIIIDTSTFTVGRSLTNSYVIRDLSISRCHCILEYAENVWTIKNRSANKTLVNDVEIQNNTKFQLKNDDIIHLTYATSYKFLFPYDANTNSPSKKRKIDRTSKNQDAYSKTNENSKVTRIIHTSQEPSTSSAEVHHLNIELNREKYVNNQYKEENNKLQLKLIEKEADILDKISNTVKLEEDILDLKASCATLEKEREELQCQLVDFECQTTLLKLRIDNLTDLSINKTLTQNILEESHGSTQTTEDESDIEILQSVLKAEISDKEILIKEKLKQTLNVVKTIRPVRPLKTSEPHILQTITTNLLQLQADIAELATKRNELESNIKSSHTNMQNKLNDVANAGGFTQSKDEFKQVLENQEDAISEMKEAFKADFLLKFYNSLELDLQCLICHELFIKSTAIDCGHIFCRSCIDRWNRLKKSCPTCRKPIKTMLSCVSLDSYIDQCFDLLFPDKKCLRQKLKDTHEADASTSTSNRNGGAQNRPESMPIVLDSSDDDSTTSNSEFENESVYGEVDYHPPRYGVCFICGDPDHWANQCPDRGRRGRRRY